MAASSSATILVLLLYINPSSSSPFNKLYAFGDSFTDTGNTHSGTGPTSFNHVSDPPYGVTFFKHPTNRYSDGRLVIDFVGQALGLPLLPPYTHVKGVPPQGVNFAVAGSTAINHAFFVKNNLTLDATPQSIGTQLAWFDSFLQRQGCYGSVSLSPACESALGRALIWLGEIGVNDYAYAVGSSVGKDTIRKLGIRSVSLFLKAVLRKGVKYLAVQGMLPTGCLTLSIVLSPEDDRDQLGCVGSLNEVMSVHNDLFLAEVKQLRREFPETVIVYLDYWNAYRSVLINHEAYGFTEIFSVCCGSGDGSPYNFAFFGTCGEVSSTSCSDPSKFINWDGVHLTEAMNKALSEMFLKGNFSDPPLSSIL